MNAGMFRHRVNIMRPTGAKGTLGARQGQDTELIIDVPCSIRPISGREVERARQLAPEATLMVEMYGDPKKPLRHTDYLVVLPAKERKLNIGFINDTKQNGIELELLCGELTQ